MLHYARWLLLSLILLITGCGSKQQFELSGFTMGSTYRIKYVSETAINKADVDAILNEIDATFSTYNSTSWLSEFNALPADSCKEFPKTKLFDHPFKTVLREALYWANLSAGRYDPTIKPLVDLWGFGADKQTHIPDINQRLQVAELINYQSLKIQDSQLCKTDVAIQLDLNSLVAGYAVDSIAKYLNQLDIQNYVIDVTGEIKVKGRHIDGSFWSIGIEAPNENQQRAAYVLEMEDISISNSGDYRNYFLVNGVRYSHTLDPNTLAPITHNLASVSVLSKNAMRADALSTLLLVLGPEQGLTFATEQGIAALFIVREAGNQFVTIRSPAFDHLITTRESKL